MPTRRPKVGVAILIPRDGQILVGKRRRGAGPGSWSGPGGHIEFGETFEQCARREAREEIGIELDEVRYLHITNDLMPQFDEHSVTIWMLATRISGEVTNASPEEHERWEWHSLANVPEPLFPSLANFRSSGVSVPGLSPR
jgi:8-oxo-dGTP diphosphatase